MAVDSFGKRLKELMKDKKITQEELADKSYITVYTIKNYCRGKTEPSYSNINTLAEILDVSHDYLFGATSIKSRNPEKGVPVPELLDDLKKAFDNASQEIRSKYGLEMSIKIISDRTMPKMLHCTRRKAFPNIEIYPRTEAENAVYALLDEPNMVIENKYHIINGNLYYENDYIKGKGGIEYLNRFYENSISVYEYMNDGNSIDDLKKAYEKERRDWGMLGELSAQDFYWLNYILGYYKKVTEQN